MHSRVVPCYALVFCLIALFSGTGLSKPAEGKMISDTIVFFAALNGIQGDADNEVLILYNPTPRDISLQGYVVNGKLQTVWANFGSADTIGAFGYLVFGDSAVGIQWVDSVHAIGNFSGADSISLRLGSTIVDFWDIETAAASDYHGAARETAPADFSDFRFLYRSPAIVRNWAPPAGTDTPFGGGGMINRPGLSDIFEDTRAGATKNSLGFYNRRDGFVDRIAFVCTAPASVREGVNFPLSCTAVVNFGQRSFSKWDGTTYHDSPVVHYTGSSAWGDMTLSAGSLNGLGVDSSFTQGLLNNFSISIMDTRGETVQLVLSDAFCTTVIHLMVLADTAKFLAPSHGDTIGGRGSAFTFRLQFPNAIACTTIFEYDTNSSNIYDSITFIDSEWGAGDAAPDSTPILSSDTAGLSYTFHWNVQADIPDAIIPNARLRIRVRNASTGSYIGDTILTPVGLRTVLADPPDTPDAVSLEWGESVQITWNQDTYGKYFVVWRDTGYPPNDTERFINITRIVLGTDSQADNRGLSLIDTHVGRAPGKRVPRLDTFFVWYITAIDTWGNIHQQPYGYGDSISAEFVYVKKSETNPTRGGRLSETIPGATLTYDILVSNTPGYSPAYRLNILDQIPYFTDYSGTSISIDTRYGFIAQTDIIDADYGRFVQVADSRYIQVDLYDPFNAGDTARIRFKVVIR